MPAQIGEQKLVQFMAQIRPDAQGDALFQAGLAEKVKRLQGPAGEGLALSTSPLAIAAAVAAAS